MQSCILFALVFLIGTVFSLPLASPPEVGAIVKKSMPKCDLCSLHSLDDLKQEAQTGVVLSSKRTSKLCHCNRVISFIYMILEGIEAFVEEEAGLGVTMANK